MTPKKMRTCKAGEVAWICGVNMSKDFVPGDELCGAIVADLMKKMGEAIVDMRMNLQDISLGFKKEVCDPKPMGLLGGKFEYYLICTAIRDTKMLHEDEIDWL